MPPLSELELTFSYALGGVTRGILVGISILIMLIRSIIFLSPSIIRSIIYKVFLREKNKSANI